jgi:hypothetical protein
MLGALFFYLIVFGPGVFGIALGFFAFFSRRSRWARIVLFVVAFAAYAFGSLVLLGLTQNSSSSLPAVYFLGGIGLFLVVLVVTAVVNVARRNTPKFDGP